MMKHIRFALLLLTFAMTSSVLGQDCTAKPRFSINAKTGEATVALPGVVPTSIHDGDAVTLVIGGQSIAATAKVTNAFGVNTIELTTASPIDDSPSAGFTSGDVSLKAKDGTVTELCPLTPINYSMHVGPTVSAASSSTTGDPTGVMRFQFQKGLVRAIPVRSGANLIPAMRNAAEELSVSIDTTDRQTKGTQFVDDNRVTGALRSPEITFGPTLRDVQAFNRVRLGIEGQFARAIHTENQNRDITLVLDGWLPFFQTLNLLSSGRTVSLPLNFRVSAGHRTQDVDGVKSGGRVADAALTYHFYVLDQYAVDLVAKTLFNDVSDRPATTPRTQHSYKAQVSYHHDPLAKFSIVTSFENGHSGPVFTKLRQFFVGVGVQQLFGIPSK